MGWERATMTYIADTHPIVWFLEANQKLGTQAKAVLADPCLSGEIETGKFGKPAGLPSELTKTLFTAKFVCALCPCHWL
ncbi:MAG: hypothetical protein NZ805_09190 [Armatimonadetes bacterium]|nr:hypothetical protein [Armatimonadota bacterium]MDW8029984.1 hypothetical protein [Armatimonadota bacterium]